jgi:hypothetical protein
MKPLDVTTLGLECEEGGRVKVTVWCKCWTAGDINDVIEWLRLAKTLMEKWEAIRKVEVQ